MKNIKFTEEMIDIARMTVIMFCIVAPWLYHVIYCFSNKEYILLLVGAILVPIGWLHGAGAFFGWW